MATGTETAAAGGWLLSKILPSIAGLFGGLSLAVFWTPEKLREKGKIASVFIAGGVSAIAGFAFTGLVAQRLGIDPTNLDAIIGLALIIGASWVALLNWASNFIQKREHMDIAEVGREVNDIRKGRAPKAPTKAPAKPPAKKPAARKTPKKP